jgi:hypothetical protein
VDTEKHFPYTFLISFSGFDAWLNSNIATQEPVAPVDYGKTEFEPEDEGRDDGQASSNDAMKPVKEEKEKTRKIVAPASGTCFICLVILFIAYFIFCGIIYNV